ncbi:MAG: hypothetical protein ACLFQR_01295 [Desulfovibrionales bacterium]
MEHTLWWSCGGSGAQGGYLSYIHGLVHAELAERLDPLFSAIAVAKEDPSLVDDILPSLRAAQTGLWGSSGCSICCTGFKLPRTPPGRRPGKYG